MILRWLTKGNCVYELLDGLLGLIDCTRLKMTLVNQDKLLSF